MGFMIDRLHFSYGERPIVRDLSLEIPPGSFYGILGPNGCGKSTFMDLLMRQLRPSGGSIIFSGKPLHKYSRQQLSKELALVPQNFYINFPYTAHEIVMMGRHPHIPRFSAPGRHDYDIVSEIMARTGTDVFIDRPITEMSGGERQRVIFARALAQETPFLLLDEATSNLDVKHALTLLEIVSQNVRNQQKTAIAVFQDMNLAAAFCNQLIFIKNGKLAAFGETRKVLTAETILNVFDVDARVSYDEFSGSQRVSLKRKL